MKLMRYEVDGVVHVGSVEGQQVRPLCKAEGNGQDEILRLAMGREDAMPGSPLDLDAVEALVPIPQPPSVRDFLTFERHFELMLRDTDGNLPQAWYDFPAFYFTSPHDLIATGGTVLPPRNSAKLDYELEVAVVVGKDGRNLTPEQAVEHIAGYVLFNDFSARDIQAVEMPIGLGPSKCKDFGGGLGPTLVTPDELDGDPGRPTGLLRATVNGRLYSEGELGEMRYDFAQLLSHASQASYIRAGDVLGSGTCSTGCIAELSKTRGEESYPWLRTGDLVELSHEVLGTLSITVGEPE